MLFARKRDTRPDLGLYVHIPFCRSKCDYCDFYSLAGREDRMADYQKALLNHIKETAPLAEAFRVDTIYFDGLSWKQMDPTFASSALHNGAGSKNLGSGMVYTSKYQY